MKIPSPNTVGMILTVCFFTASGFFIGAIHAQKDAVEALQDYNDLLHKHVELQQDYLELQQEYGNSLGKRAELQKKYANVMIQFLDYIAVVKGLPEKSLYPPERPTQDSHPEPPAP